MAFGSVMAETIDFSYNGFGQEPDWFGYKKAERYDVGIRISDPGLIGKRIIGLKVRINGTETEISDCKGWLSGELNAETIDKTSFFNPDISSDGSFADGWLKVDFPQSYTIPEEGVYVGYSYDVDEAEDTVKKTVAVTDGNNAGGLWFHSSTTQKSWADMTKRNGIVSTITVILEGEFLKNAAIPMISGDLRIAEGEDTSLTVEVINQGNAGISTIEYTYEVGGNQGKGIYNFSNPVASVYGQKGIATIDIDPVYGLGEAPFTIKVTGVNGTSNEVNDATDTSIVTVQKFVPIYRPLVEEYTGLNCGYCPRGYVMLEDMKESYGDRFVALSYHSRGWESNAMDCIQESQFPVQPSGYPAASLNRNQTVDPSNIPALWEKCYMNQTSADIQVDWEWADDNPSVLRATARSRFLQDIEESDYRLAFVMLADRLSNPKWVQSNYYSDQKRTEQYSSRFWDLFIGQDEHIIGLTFNDIVVHTTDYKGIEGSLPQQIESGEWYEYTYEINPEDITNLKGTHIVENFDLTRMVAVIVDGRNGKPLNCISSTYPANGNGAEMTLSDKKTNTTVYFDMQGRRIEAPAKGMYIKTEILNDGSIKTSKIIK